MKKLVTLIVLAACAQIPPPLPAQQADTCNAAQYADLIGRDATALETVMLLGKVRVIRPGQAVTMDFLADRINFMIDDTEKVASISCG